LTRKWPQQWFHPDFGIFQPSAELRRTGRITVLAAALGAIAVASMILVLLHPDLSLAIGNRAWTGYYVHEPPMRPAKQSRPLMSRRR
jgi:hypothetical protein